MKEDFIEKAACERCRRFLPRAELKRSGGKLWCVDHFPAAIDPGSREKKEE